MPAPVRSAFAQRVGADTRTLHSELEKLKMYIGPSRDTVTMEDLEAVTSSVASGEPFDLVSAIQLRSPLQVARGVERLRIDKNAAFAAAAVLINTLNDLCAIADALERQWLVGGQWHLPIEQLPQRLARQQGFVLTKLIEAARRYTLNELRAARHYAIEMRFKLVDSTSQDPWAIVEPVLLRIVARRPARQR
jgi:DNA polymerase III delta subunit